jgi:FO synthase subunit 1
MTGTSLGHRLDADQDILVLGEDDPNVITFSHAVAFTLSHACRNHCPYCSFHKKDTLTVPYSTIKTAKKARTLGVREALYLSGERPDKFSQVRSVLDLWGFASYLDYVYTVCELGFLEGLIPVIEVGFLSPLELKKLSEICALNRVMLDSVDNSAFSKVYSKSPGKKLELRLKLLEWSGRLKFPTITGLMVGIGESKSHRESVLKEITKIHQTYGTIHEVSIQNFIPEPGTPYSGKTPPSKADMLAVVEQVLAGLPSDITVTVPLALNTDMEDFIKVGIRDFGHVIEGKNPYYKTKPLTYEDMEATASKAGFRLQQRFPLKKSFIKNGIYSKKLGQVFDAYRYKIKKDGQDVKGKS